MDSSSSDFVNRIRQKIHDEDIKPEWIDIEITAGVDEPNQLEILKVLECDEIQGYIFGRPVPPEIFELEHIDKATLSSK